MSIEAKDLPPSLSNTDEDRFPKFLESLVKEIMDLKVRVTKIENELTR